MSDKNKFNIHPKLKKAIEDDDLVVFVGAGLSKSLENENGEEIGDWKNLLNKMLDYLIQEGVDKVFNDLKPLVEPFEPLRLLELIEDKNIGNAMVQNFLKSFFTLKDSNNLLVHKNLCKLSNKIITTNYDEAFEMADRRFARNVAYKGRNGELSSFSDSKKITLLKLHGCISHIDEMVLFPSQYRALYDNTSNASQHILMHFKDAIKHHTVLFIGTGMGDFQIKNIFQQLKEVQGGYAKTHFIISDRDLDTSLKELKLERVKVDNYEDDIPPLLQQLLYIKENRPRSEEYQRLEEEKNRVEQEREDLREENKTLKQKGQKVKKLENFIKENALKHFDKGLGFSQEEDYESAIREYQYSVELDNKNSFAYYNWGVALVGLVRLQTDVSEKERLYNEAVRKNKKAIELKPDYSIAFNNWGGCLISLAELEKDISEKEKFYEEAISKFQKAVELESDYSDAFSNWANCLVGLSYLKEGAEREAILQEALAISQKTVELGDNYYNLACCYALLNLDKKALFYLEKSLKAEEYDVAFVEEDSDWDSLRDSEAFIKILDKYRK